jgi:cell division protease FtsH
VNTSVKTLIFWAVILVSAIVLWQVARNGNTQAQHTPEISYSEFLSQVNAGNVAKVTIARSRATGNYGTGGAFTVVIPASQEQMLASLQQKNVEVWYADSSGDTSQWLMNLAPLGLLAALWFFMIRRMQAKTKPIPQVVGGASQFPPT